MRSFYFLELWHLVPFFGWQRIATHGWTYRTSLQARADWDLWLEDWRDTFAGPDTYFARQYRWIDGFGKVVERAEYL